MNDHRGPTETRFDELKRYVRFTEQDAHRLVALRAVAAPHFARNRTVERRNGVEGPVRLNNRTSSGVALFWDCGSPRSYCSACGLTAAGDRPIVKKVLQQPKEERRDA